ncbi:FAD-binding oxidoreductase [Microvirga antarctica]|uniref:FAD-binding oxidoreductase n=1 Tax=Microvirga antarctica TaxID=2819233 RepID=UPI001B3092D1|nr:FAD-binding oxidoreductase [Microvirga antarctica]
MSDVIRALIDALGPERVLTDALVSVRNTADAASLPPLRPAALVRPESTAEVATCLRICNTLHQPVVIQGGMTGLAGGAHPQPGEIALSLERMVGIEEIDTQSGTLTALAGTTLAAIQDAAAEAGFLYGVDLGARGTCTIGGNVATNAGGNQVLRYGMTRRNVLGLEVVLADGRVLRSLNKMLKNNAGYDWPQAIIGSEGTLGVITRVVVSLHPRPTGIQSALLAVGSVADAVSLLRRFDALLPGRLLVFEAMWREYMTVTVERAGLTRPFPGDPDLTILIEAAMGEDGSSGADAFAETLGLLLDEGLVTDAVVAQSQADRQRFWAYREANYAFGRLLPKGAHFDVSIPLARMGEAVARLRAEVAARWPSAIPIVFGHLADSNLHIGIYTPDFDAAMGRAINKSVYAIVADTHGSVSAEHGIGTLKRPYLPLSRSETEIAVMQAIKHTLDPHAILNRGRVLPDPA